MIFKHPPSSQSRMCFFPVLHTLQYCIHCNVQYALYINKPKLCYFYTVEIGQKLHNIYMVSIPLMVKHKWKNKQYCICIWKSVRLYRVILSSTEPPHHNACIQITMDKWRQANKHNLDIRSSSSWVLLLCNQIYGIDVTLKLFTLLNTLVAWPTSF